MEGAVVEGAVVHDALRVGGQVGEDLEREVTQVFLRAFDLFAWVRFGDGEAEVLACDFPARHAAGDADFGVVGFAGEGAEVGDERVEVFVVGVGFEAEFVFEGHREGDDEVQSGEFGEEIGFADFGGFRVSFVCVDPDVASEIP